MDPHNTYVGGVPHIQTQVFPLRITGGVLPSEQRLDAGFVGFGAFTALPQVAEEQVFAYVQDEFDPPPTPSQRQVWVVPQAVCPPSFEDTPDLQNGAAVAQIPFTTSHEEHAALAFVQVAVVPPPEPRHCQLRVVLQAVALLSFAEVPPVHSGGVALHCPLTEEAAPVIVTDFVVAVEGYPPVF